MSYVALATDQFDKVVRFYGEDLGFPLVEEWDRERGRGRRFDLGHLRLEILDNTREQKALKIFYPGERFHIVIEVSDIEAARRDIRVDAPQPSITSWGAILFQIKDPDGVPVTFLQWKEGGAV